MKTEHHVQGGTPPASGSPSRAGATGEDLLASESVHWQFLITMRRSSRDYIGFSTAKAVAEYNSPSVAADVVACEVIRGRDFGCRWHFHYELELTHLLRGGTHRWIGDNISTLHKGDTVLIGSNLPHDYRNDPVPGEPVENVHAIVLQFPPDFLGADWLEASEMGKIKELFHLAGHGLVVSGKTRTAVARRMRQAPKTNGVRRLILLMEIFDLLSCSQELTPIASPGFMPDLQIANCERIGSITTYIQQRFATPLYLEQVARHVGMSPTNLSRYFRARTGKTFPAYPNELRIARVCRFLAETDRNVTEIALSCGFESMSNFEEQFCRLQGCPPTAYRRKTRHSGPIMFLGAPQSPGARDAKFR